MRLRPLIFLTVILSLAGTSSFLSAQEGKTPDPTTKMNLTGSWDFQTSDHKEYGVCERGKPYSGTLTITQDGTKLKLVLQSGPIVCSPPTACAYQGKLKGKDAHFHSASVVSGEGGSRLASIHLSFDSPSTASGKSRTIQQRIGGSMCEWTNHLQLTRKK